MVEQLEYWRKLAEEDIGTAEYLLAGGRYLFVLFFCQQAIEKTLKALVNLKTKDFPPRVHNLMVLAEKAELECDEVQGRFLSDLNTYYIQSRYPEEISALGSKVNNAMAVELLAQTKVMLAWLQSLLP